MRKRAQNNWSFGVDLCLIMIIRFMSFYRCLHLLLISITLLSGFWLSSSPSYFCFLSWLFVCQHAKTRLFIFGCLFVSLVLSLHSVMYVLMVFLLIESIICLLVVIRLPFLLQYSASFCSSSSYSSSLSRFSLFLVVFIIFLLSLCRDALHPNLQNRKQSFTKQFLAPMSCDQPPTKRKTPQHRYAVELKIGPIFAFLQVKNWSFFCFFCCFFCFFCFFVFEYLFLPAETRGFFKNKQETTPKTQLYKLKYSPIMLRNILGPVFILYLDQFLTFKMCILFVFFFGLKPLF